MSDGQQGSTRTRPRMSFGLPAPAVTPTPAPAPTSPEIGSAEAPADDQPAVRGKMAPSRQGRKGVTFYLNPEAWKELRILSMDLDRSSDRLMVEATNLLFEKYGRQRVAREPTE